MDVDFFEPKTSLGKSIQCLTLTDSFFRKKKIDSTKQSLLKNFLTFNGIPIQYMDQVHGRSIEKVDCHTTFARPETDGLLSSNSNLALAVFSADCMPIAISKKDGTEFAVVHAGWKGLFAGVIEACLDAFSSDSSNLNAWIGPSISKKNYEVDQDLYDAFFAKNTKSKSNFSKQDMNKWCFDLQGEATRILRDFGVDVQHSEICTYDSAIMYSFRKKETEKRMITIIWRNE